MDYEPMIDQLRGVEEQLREAAYSELHDALENGDTTREKQVQKALRAVSKAISELRSLGD